MYLQQSGYTTVRRLVFTVLSIVILSGYYATAAIAEKLYEDVSDGVENTESIDTAPVSILHVSFRDPAYYGLTIRDTYTGSYFTNNGEINISSDVTDYVIGVNNMSSSAFLENGASVTVGANPSAGAAQGIGIFSLYSMDNKSNVNVTAEGGADSSASDSSSSAYGVRTEIDVTNSGVITATATGGSASEDASAYAYGIYSEGIVTNESESITAIATGGTLVNTGTDIIKNQAESYGIYSNEAITSTGGSIVSVANGGTVTCNDDSSTGTLGYGLLSYEDVSNSSSIIVQVTGGTVYSGGNPYAYSSGRGIQADAGVINNNSITVTVDGATVSSDSRMYASATGYGIDAGDEVINNSAVTVSANGGTISGNNRGSADANVYGISSEGDINNSGTIAVTATGGAASTNSGSSSKIDADAYGIYSDSNVANSGDVTVIATGGTALDSSNVDDSASAFGIQSEDNPLVNSGAIIVTATAGSFATEGEAEAYGLYSSGGVNNTGAVTATASSGANSEADFAIDAYGIYSMGSDGDVVNSGAVTATATAGKLSSGWRAQAYGIHSEGGVSNSGAITVSAADGTGSEDSSVLAVGIYAQGDVTNSAAITVNAVGGDAATDTMDVIAHGIAFRDELSYSLDSTGLISVSAENISIGAGGIQEAYQVYVQDGSLSITSYAMEFQGTQDELNAVYSGAIKHEDDSDEITFNDATLYAHTPEAINKTYDIPTLVEGADVSNQFASVIAVHPDVDVALIDGAAGDNQQIQFSYEPEVSSTVSSLQATQTVGVKVNNTVLNQLFVASAGQSIYSTGLAAREQNDTYAASAKADSNFSRMVASLSDTPATGESEADVLVQDRNVVFLKPVYVYSTRKDSGYSANSYGIVGGYTRRMDDDVYLGVHGGYSYTNVNYLGDGYTDREEEINTGFAGLHGGTVIDDRWYIAGVSSFFYGKYYLRDSNPMHRETAKHDALTVRTSVTGGYVIPAGEHRFLPELGLTHTWQHSDSYSSVPETGPETVFGTLDNHELYGSARLSWYYCYEMEDGWVMFPSLGAGVTQILTDGKISNSLSLASASQQVVDEEDYTTFTPFCSLTLEKAGYFMVFAYEGGFSDRVQNTLLSFQFGVGF